MIFLAGLSGFLQVVAGGICSSIIPNEWFRWMARKYRPKYKNWVVQGALMKYAGIAGYALVVISMLIIPQLQFKKSKNADTYFSGEVELD